jgi:hypothetical protein
MIKRKYRDPWQMRLGVQISARKSLVSGINVIANDFHWDRDLFSAREISGA